MQPFLGVVTGLALSLLLMVPTGVAAPSIAELQTRQRLLENQLNVHRLGREISAMQEELRLLLRRQQRDDSDRGLQPEIERLQDSIATGDILIRNIDDIISRQRLLLSTMERGSAPSTLDMALSKALNANLSELANNLADNEAARTEVANLRRLLKQQAGLGMRHNETPSSVSYAAEQQLAEDEYLRLLELMGDTDSGEGADKPIEITGTDGDKPFSRRASLNYLDQSQYHLEARVHSGKMTFTVDGRPWHLTIPPEDDGATYVVIYDLDEPDQPRLVMFNKNLLLE